MIAGHVDSTTGPAVFYRLGRLGGGEVVDVAGPTGRTVAFRVDAVEQHPKDRFPTAAVYGPTDDPVLRLITCGGDFDRATDAAGRWRVDDTPAGYAERTPPRPTREDPWARPPTPSPA